MRKFAKKRSEKTLTGLKTLFFNFQTSWRELILVYFGYLNSCCLPLLSQFAKKKQLTTLQECTKWGFWGFASMHECTFVDWRWRKSFFLVKVVNRTWVKGKSWVKKFFLLNIQCIEGMCSLLDNFCISSPSFQRKNKKKEQTQNSLNHLRQKL